MADKLTASIVTVALRVKDLIVARAVPLGISMRGTSPDSPHVYYGDQEILPAGTVVCVEPGGKSREWSGAPFQLETNFTLQILAYVAKLESDEATRIAADNLAESLESLLHNPPEPGQMPGQLYDANGDRLVLQGYVKSIDFGYTVRGQSLYRSANLTYAPMSKTSGTLP